MQKAQPGPFPELLVVIRARKAHLLFYSKMNTKPKRCMYDDLVFVVHGNRMNCGLEPTRRKGSGRERRGLA